MKDYSVSKRWGLFHRIVSQFLYYVTKLFVLILFKERVYGLENLPDEGEGTLLASNHLSHLDSLILGAVLFPRKRLIHFLAAKDWMDLWYFGWLRLVGAFPAYRGKQREKTIISAVALLKDGSTVSIFPEGGRSRTGKWQKARPGVGWIAHQAGPNTAVIPIFLYGTQNVLPVGKLMPNLRSQIYIFIGEPINLSKYYKLPESLNTSRRVVKKIVKGIIQQKNRFIKTMRQEQA